MVFQLPVEALNLPVGQFLQEPPAPPQQSSRYCPAGQLAHAPQEVEDPPSVVPADDPQFKRNWPSGQHWMQAVFQEPVGILYQPPGQSAQVPSFEAAASLRNFPALHVECSLQAALDLSLA